MFYSFEIAQLPTVTEVYTVTRNTVWQTADVENILIFIRDGMCEFTIENETFVAKKGDVVFIPGNCSYIRKHIDGTMCTMTYVHFGLPVEVKQSDVPSLFADISNIKKELNEQILRDEHTQVHPQTIYIQNHNKTEDFDRILKYLGGINLISTHREIMCYLQSELMLCVILANISQTNVMQIHSLFEDESIAKIPPKLKQAIRYIRKNYSAPITLEELALYCNVSKQQLTRYFRNELGTTPINYVLEYKVSKAKNMLFKNPNLSVKQIAYELGFGDQHYFSRLFKKITGETPGEYRDRTVNYVPPQV